MILIDTRGQQDVADKLGQYLTGHDIEAEPTILHSGDFAWQALDGHLVGVERKTLSDLAHSLMGDRVGDTSRLEGQLANMLEDYDERVLLLDDTIGEVDGYVASMKRTRGDKPLWYPAHVTKFTPHRLAALIWSVQKNGVDFVYSCGELGPTIMAMYVYTQQPPEKHKFMRHFMRPTPPTYTFDPQVVELMSLWKGLPEASAIALIAALHTAWQVIHTDRKQLMEFAGVGKGRVDKLYKLLGKD